MKKDFKEIEKAIEEEIARESIECDLDRYDIEEIRVKHYKANGWSHDPFYDEIMGTEEEEEEYDEDACYDYFGCRDYYKELGLSRSDFF